MSIGGGQCIDGVRSITVLVCSFQRHVKGIMAIAPAAGTWAGGGPTSILAGGLRGTPHAELSPGAFGETSHAIAAGAATEDATLRAFEQAGLFHR
jgi:hypothetical protein